MKKINNIKAKYIAVIFVLIIGVFMMVIPSNPKQEHEVNGLDTTLVLEERISKMLKDTYSLENVSVILTYDTNGEKFYEHVNNSNLTVKIDEQTIKSEKLPYVRGALIAVNNIDFETSEKIKEAISVLLGISSDKVTVIYN